MTQSELYDALRPYLRPGEQVLWMGQPTQTRAPGNVVFMTVFSLFFAGFAVFWMAMAATAGGFFFLFGVPFLLVGAGLLYSTTAGRKKALGSSVYAVTETRALILVTLPLRGTDMREYVFSMLSGVNVENVQGNVGSIRFEDAHAVQFEHGVRYGRYRRGSTVSYSTDRDLMTAFLAIENVHSVYHMISERIGK